MLWNHRNAMAGLGVAAMLATLPAACGLKSAPMAAPPVEEMTLPAPPMAAPLPPPRLIVVKARPAKRRPAPKPRPIPPPPAAPCGLLDFVVLPRCR